MTKKVPPDRRIWRLGQYGSAFLDACPWFGGDVIAAAMGLYMIWEARNIGMSRSAMLRMAGNVGIDWVIGLVPLVGDIFDVGFKANLRNAALMRDFAEKRHADTTPGQTPRQPPTRTPVQGLGRSRGANA